MENSENSWKTRILSSFLYAVFTYTVPDGGDRLNMKETVELDWFFFLFGSQASSSVGSKTSKPFFRKLIT